MAFIFFVVSEVLTAESTKLLTPAENNSLVVSQRQTARTAESLNSVAGGLEAHAGQFARIEKVEQS